MVIIIVIVIIISMLLVKTYTMNNKIPLTWSRTARLVKALTAAIRKGGKTDQFPNLFIGILPHSYNM